MVNILNNDNIILQFCTIIMAKTQEKITAKHLYFKLKSQKEIAHLVGVQEKTISTWIKKGGWREERDARLNSSKNQIQDLKKLIAELTQQRIDLFPKMEKAKQDNDLEAQDSLKKQSNSISQEIGNYNRALITLDKENRISLATYLEVMEQIFNAIQKHDAKIYMKLIDFQQEHLTEISIKLG